MATRHKYKHKEKKRWTYGAELELADWPRQEKLPVKGMAIDEGAYTNVNSDGVAVDGPGKLYHLGGEILTAPSVNPSGSAEQQELIKERWPEASLNYRLGLNVHVRVPGLRESLKRLKRVQRFIHRVMPDLLPVIDPIPKPTEEEYGKSLLGAKRCYRTRLRDHYTLMPSNRLKLQAGAKTPKEFFEAEAIHLPTGKVHWAITPRVCVSLRQMLQTDTIEFRHFPEPVSAEELLNTTLWCKMFTEASLDGSGVSAEDLLEEFEFESRSWPKFMPYDPWLDKGWYYTTRHRHAAETVLCHIKEWLEKYPGCKGGMLCLK